MAADEQVETTTKERFSPKLAIAGGAAVVAGFIILLPHGQQFDVYDAKVCVTDYSIDRGGCGPRGAEKWVGVIAIGAGSLMAVIGSLKVTKHVSVAPSKQGIGGQATVRW